MKEKLVRQYFIIVFFLSLAIALTIRFPMILNLIFNDAGNRHVPSLSEYLSYFFSCLPVSISDLPGMAGEVNLI